MSLNKDNLYNLSIYSYGQVKFCLDTRALSLDNKTDENTQIRYSLRNIKETMTVRGYMKEWVRLFEEIKRMGRNGI